MNIYTVHWVEKLNVRAQGIEAESEEEAISIAKNTTDLDIDTDPHESKPTKFNAEMTG